MRIVSSLIVLLVSSPVSAATIDAFFDRTAFEAAAGSTFIETFDSVSADASFKDQTVVVNDLSLRADNVNGARIDVPPFASGGYSVNGTPYLRVFLESSNDIFRISFASPVTAFAADFRSLNARGGMMRDTVFTVLGQTPLLPTVVSAGDTSFFGIVSDTAFSEVAFTRGARDSRFGLDNVQTASVAPIPLPATGLLLLGAIVGLSAVARRRRFALR